MRKRQRRLDGVDQPVLSLSARGLTTGEIAAQAVLTELKPPLNAFAITFEGRIVPSTTN